MHHVYFGKYLAAEMKVRDTCALQGLIQKQTLMSYTMHSHYSNPRYTERQAGLYMCIVLQMIYMFRHMVKGFVFAFRPNIIKY